MAVIINGTTGLTTSGSSSSGGGGVSTSTALGGGALFTNSSGANLVAIGYQAGYSTTAGPNVFVGSQAGYTNSTGANNIGIGYQALYSNTTASNSVAVGYQAGYSNTTNPQNTFVGYTAGYSSTGGYNSAFGYQAGNAITSGTSNTALGRNSMSSGAGVTGSNNTGIGDSALLSLTSGASNVAIGLEALKVNTTASNNTAVGYQAGYSNTTGIQNAFFGYQAGYSSTGGNNTFIGQGAGYYVTSGAKNTIIGEYTGNSGGLDIRTASNYVVLSDGDGNPRQIINSSGNVYVGTYPPKYSTGTGMFTVSQLSNNWDTAVFGNIFVDCQTAFDSDPKPGIVFGIPYTSTASATGVSIQAYKMTASTGDFGQGFRITTQQNGSAPSYKMTIDGVGNIGAPSGTNIYNASDVRLKKNIQTLDNALDKINALRGVEFNWVDNFCEAENNKTLYGFIAQEVESVDANLTDPFGPEQIKVDDLTVDNPIRVNEKFIVPLLVNAIKELKALVDAQAARIAILEAK
jgi:hypothetical protein